jgi:hypothetical protein
MEKIQIEKLLDEKDTLVFEWQKLFCKEERLTDDEMVRFRELIKRVKVIDNELEILQTNEKAKT